jgi:hypothetical protein
MGDAERLRTYLAGWDDAIRCLAETLIWVPDEQLPVVVRNLADRTGRSKVTR